MSEPLPVLLEVRDAHFPIGQPSFNWVVLDASTNEIIGFFEKRPEADAAIERMLEPLDENPRYGPGNPDWEHDRLREDSFRCVDPERAWVDDVREGLA